MKKPKDSKHGYQGRDKSRGKGRDKRNSHKKLTIFLVTFLVVLCIGFTELIASYFFDPALYQRVTEPVRQGIQTAVEGCRQAAAQTVAFGDRVVNGISDWWTKIAASRLKDEEAQIAGDPAFLQDNEILNPSITELALLDGQAVLTGGTVPIVYYNQGDADWSEQRYGSDDIGRYGCGPVAMAMAVSSMTDQKIDPVQMAEQAVAGGYWAKQNGSYLSIINGLAEKNGLVCQTLSERTPEALQDTLLSGKLIVALMGPGHFTKSGHFILLRGVTLSGTILVADPNSETHSLMEWEPQLILDELSHSINDGAPLWVLSKNESLTTD